MTEEDLKEIKRLLNLKVVDMRDKTSCLDLINKYINGGSKWCLTCDPAVRQMFMVLRSWCENNGIIKTNG
jgi:hypothetical protein